MDRNKLLTYCNTLLNIELFNDMSPNGLQVEGKDNIKKIICAVSASLNSIDYAVEKKADMLLVHHGMFWKSEFLPIVSWKKERIKKLLSSNINLVAYHLPLDAHTEIGNNAQLAKIFNWQVDKRIGLYNIFFVGQTQKRISLSKLADEIEQKLARKPLVIGNLSKEIKKIIWCSGAAQNYFQLAVDEKVDVFITGEVSEYNFHLANETGIAMISAGHHATEKYGVKALGSLISNVFSLETEFYDDLNPV